MERTTGRNTDGTAIRRTVKAANIFDSIECYGSNLAELANTIDDQFVTEEGDIVKMDVMTVFALIQVLWDKIKETALECEGKEIRVDLPSNWVGMVLNAALAAVGLKL
jgi:hypothetical protein